MATDAASGGHGGAGHGDTERQDFLRILFFAVSWMGIAALAWTFASALGPVDSGARPALKAPATMARLR